MSLLKTCTLYNVNLSVILIIIANNYWIIIILISKILYWYSLICAWMYCNKVIMFFFPDAYAYGVGAGYSGYNRRFFYWTKYSIIYTIPTYTRLPT